LLSASEPVSVLGDVLEAVRIQRETGSSLKGEWEGVKSDCELDDSESVKKREEDDEDSEEEESGGENIADLAMLVNRKQERDGSFQVVSLHVWANFKLNQTAFRHRSVYCTVQR
jgi:hypothetical protein